MKKKILIAVRRDSVEFADLFRRYLPEHDVLLEVPNSPTAVAYAVLGVPPRGLLARLSGLELILSVNAGVEHLVTSGEVPTGVPVVRMVDPGLVDGMVEWVAAQVLGWHRNLIEYQRQQQQRVWNPLPERLASERTVTVLGAGELGAPVARMLASFGFLTRVWRRTPEAIDGITCFAGQRQLTEAIDGADVLVNLLPATPLTVNLVDSGLMRRMAPGALIVNGGRGATIVDADLLRVLDEGRLGAAALDVFRTEPLPPEHPFWAHPKISITPHVAAITHPHTSVPIMAESIRRHEQREPLANLVDFDRGY